MRRGSVAVVVTCHSIESRLQAAHVSSSPVGPSPCYTSEQVILIIWQFKPTLRSEHHLDNHHCSKSHDWASRQRFLDSVNKSKGKLPNSGLLMVINLVNAHKSNPITRERTQM